MAVHQLAKAWMAKFRSDEPDDYFEVPLETWYQLAREVIVQTLHDQSGLQLKMTLAEPDKDFVYCQIRAPLKVR